MKRTPKKIQNILSRYFLFLILLLLSLAFVIISLIQSYYLKSNIENSIMSTCSSIAQAIDLQIQQMDTVCLNTIQSSVIKDTFSLYINKKDATPYQQSQYKKTLANTMTSIRGMDSSIRQINLYGRTNGGFGFGNYTGSFPVDVTSQPWYPNTWKQQGRRYIPPWSMTSSQTSSAVEGKEQKFLSLFRMYYDTYQNPAGFVEVRKYYDALFDRAIHPNSKYELTIVIYDNEGNVLYPCMESKKPSIDYYSHRSSSAQTIYNSKTKSTEYVYASTMDYSEFTTMVSIKNYEFYTPIYHSLSVVLLLYLLTFFLCYHAAKLLSAKISAPIMTIYEFLSNKEKQKQFDALTMKDTAIIEIDQLRDSINQAIQFQKSSVSSMMLLKQQELQAQALALQAQMNPHFLYNSLNTISAMAEEGLTEPISSMCQDITSILRYISSNKEPTALVEDELEYCDMYLKCLAVRFKDSLHYEFDIDDSMLELNIPKLCVQLLIENAVKYTSTVSPPWIILIKGWIEDTNWYITVIDNGPGFNPATKMRLRTQMEQILEQGLLPSLELDGMGLLNIFLRFYLLYHNSFLFDFGTKKDGGAFIKIGGKIQDET